MMNTFNKTPLSYSHYILSIEGIKAYYDTEIFPRFLHNYVKELSIHGNEFDYWYEELYDYLISKTFENVSKGVYRTLLINTVNRNDILESIFKIEYTSLRFYMDAIIQNSNVGFGPNIVVKLTICGDVLVISKRDRLPNEKF